MSDDTHDTQDTDDTHDTDNAAATGGTDGTRSFELEIEVPGTPDAVWRAIATGPGISSWYVPHVVEERAGGAASASFGPEPELQIAGRVAAWEPPHRILFDGGEGAGGLAFEWLVEARDGGSCVVRLVNSGFGTGEEWDGQFDGMQQGWQLFLRNLQLHLTYFPGQTARALLPMASWPGPRDRTWAELTAALGIPADPGVGTRVVIGAVAGAAIGGDVEDGTAAAPRLAGTVLDAAPWRLALLLDEPAPGTAFVAVEGDGDAVGVSVWSYLYGEAGAAAADRDDPRWRAWLAARAVAPS